MYVLKRAIKQLAAKCGVHIGSAARFGLSIDRDLRCLLEGIPNPVLFDVGANVGQTSRHYRSLFPESEIHAFEPSPATFRVLEERLRGHRIRLSNVGVGRAEGALPFYEHEKSDMSSFLRASPELVGPVTGEQEVPLTTIDAYAETSGIETIHLLKTDTQGFDLEVLAGAARMLSIGAAKLIYTEITMEPLYEGQASLEELLRFLGPHGYRLVSFYNVNRRSHDDAALYWCDALFVHEAWPGRRRRA